MEQKIDALFSQWDRPGTPGVAVAVIRSGKIIYSKGFGSAQLEYDVPITPETVFHVASVSKEFTGMAVSLLVAQGKVALDDEVQKYLPWVPVFSDKITVDQLLHHVSGVRDQWELLHYAGWNKDDLITQAHIRNIMERQRELNFKPGAEYSYSNMGYSLLAEIVAAVSGQSFAEFVAENILAPLNMSHSHFHDDHEMIVSNRAYSYLPSNEGGYHKALLNFANVGATSLFTTAEDLALWLDNFRHLHVAGSEGMKVMQHTINLNDGTPLNYAHGIYKGIQDGMTIIVHNGEDAGYRSHAVWYAEPEVGVVVLTNLGSIDPSALAVEVSNIVLDIEPAVPEQPVTDEQPLIQLDPDSYGDYTGTYSLSNGFMLEIKEQNGKLTGEAFGMQDPMLAISETEFLLQAFATRITFQRNAKGEINEFTAAVRGEIVEGHRIAAVQPPGEEQLRDYTGEYYSPELGAFYSVVLTDGKLEISHHRRGSSAMIYAGEDKFVSQLLPNILFERDNNGHVSGLRVSGDRAKNILFKKFVRCYYADRRCENFYG